MRLAHSMGSDDDMFRIWSGPEGSSHKEPLPGIRIHRVHGRFFIPFHTHINMRNSLAVNAEHASSFRVQCAGGKRGACMGRSQPIHAGATVVHTWAIRCRRVETTSADKAIAATELAEA